MIASHESFITTKRFGALDGLRALSVIAVVWHHTSGTPGPAFLAKGGLGVDFFFAISGFLITTLLLRESRTRGGISLGKFYARRSLRILPAYTAVLGLYVVIVLLTRRDTAEGKQFLDNLPAFATYTSNWFVDLTRGESVTFYFAWSLATEEQFYLFWPPLLVGLLMLRHRIVWPLIALTTLIAVSQWALIVPDESVLAVRILASLSLPILLSAAFAILLEQRSSFRWLALILGRRWSSPLLFVLLAASIVFDVPPQVPQVLMVLAVATVCMSEQTALHPVLSWRPLAFVGVISYGIYLLHMLCANAIRPVVNEEFGVLLFVGTTASVIVAAYLSFRYFESPILRGKRRYEVQPVEANEMVGTSDAARRDQPSGVRTTDVLGQLPST